MPVEGLIITEQTGPMKAGKGIVVATDFTGGYGLVSVTLATSWRNAYLSAEEDPVLAELWDNDEDAVYDSM